MPVSFIKGLGVALSLNDPRWGHDPDAGRKAQESKRPGNDGPPDLDQLWRDFNTRLTRIFGKRNEGGGGGGPYRPDARGVKLTVGVAGAIAATVWLASGCFIVPDGQVGVVTTFGKLSHTVGPGFSWRWPAPFQAVETVNTAQVQTAEIGYRANLRNKQPNEALMLTGDQNIVDVQFAVQYKIKEPVAWLFNNRDREETVRDAAETVVRELVGKNKLDTLLYQGREQVAAEARSRIQQLTDRYKLGAEIVGVNVQQITPPDQVAAAFEDVLKANEERTRLRNEAQAYADDVVPQARAKADRMRQDAEADRAATENKATGEAARFDKIQAEYAKAPGVTRDRMYLDTMQQIYSSTSKIMIDAKTGTNQLVLPLDQMLSRSVANEAAIGSKSGPVMLPQQGQVPVQTQAQPPAQQPAQPQAQAQAQAVPAQPAPAAAATTTTAAPAAASAAPAPSDARHRDVRSRENGRERESR